jgi:D-beta-D-heptose 7-phosphate kinase/D-beta-D-heptose 1-phosphate adenosyltransferase
MIPLRPKSPIVVIGDAMLDCYVSGKVERISPEAPVPVVQRTAEGEVAGGAANVAANAARLGAEARLVSVVGDDEEGRRLAALLAELGVAFAPVVDRGRPTVSKTRVMSGVHQLLRVDREDRAPIGAPIEDAALEALAAALAGAGALIVSDYAKGMLTDRVLSAALALARRAGAPALVDPKRRDFSAYKGAALIKPNRAELAEATGLPCESDDEVERAARLVVAATGASLLVTRSEKGMTYVAPGAAAIHMPTQSKEVFDVSGAGDTAIAAVACGFVAGLPIEQTMRLANLAAGVVISKPGTATVSFDELRAAAEARGDLSVSGGGVATREEAIAMREHWRREGLTVGFTNGCFDLIHPGHIAILRGAARHCDRLIVGLNSDASTRRLKGPGRPVQDEASRAAVIGAMRSVALVVAFEEDTPIELIAALSPDVLVKGADYAENEIVGAELVRARGGRVARVPLVEGQSTTRLIRRGAALGSAASEEAK